MTSGAAIELLRLRFYAFKQVLENIAVVAEDMENPEKDVPKSIFIGNFIVFSILYCNYWDSHW